MTPEEARRVQAARLSAGYDWCPGDMHDSLEEDMLDTIAGMEWEWSVQVKEGSKWFHVHSWRKSLDEAEWDLRKNKGWSPDGAFRIVRRLVGPVEVIDG